jgi:Right handed beta helix region
MQVPRHGISMRSILKSPVLLALYLLFPARALAQSPTCASIQQAINALPVRGGEVVVPAGMYVCSTPIVIDRNNVVLRGAGAATVLRLANGANAPVLIIGQTAPAPTVTRQNIRVSDLTIDGNRANQTCECWNDCSPSCASNPIRNNGITIRRANDVSIERVTLRNARSGGLVTERVCRRLVIRDLTSSGNQFDGIASYETEDSIFSGLELTGNLAAGLSLDLGFNHNILSNIVILDSGKVGIFMRYSIDNLFGLMQIRNSGEHGIFLAQVETDATRPAAGNTFNGVVVKGSKGAGIRVNDPSCVNNSMAGSQLIANVGGCVSESVPGLLRQSGNVCR